ncbi:MAG: hypothetical protein R3C27_15825 [Hyphomonadaceae bacterium]
MTGADLYGDLFERLAEARSTQNIEDLSRMCGPFVVQPTPEFAAAHHRVLLVGQETNGWYTVEDILAPDKGLEEALFWYRDFALADKHPASRSPFWSFHRKIAAGLGLDWRAVLWSNLVRFDGTQLNDRGSLVGHPSEPALLDVQRGVLSSEIDGLRVDTVIFLTGPNYDHIIRDELGDIEFSAVGQYPVRHLAHVKHHGRRARMMRTYHPAYLRRTGLFDGVAEEIVHSCV